MNTYLMQEVYKLKKARDEAQDAYYKAEPGKALVLAQQRLTDARVAYRSGTEEFFEDALAQIQIENDLSL